MDPNSSYVFRQIEATERQTRLRNAARTGSRTVQRTWRGQSFSRRIGAVLFGARASQQPTVTPMNQNVACATPTPRPHRA